tara:strand:+ start:1616 stop:1957 length:342 start_codon:yes stop_codon:yes gene_type:complete
MENNRLKNNACRKCGEVKSYEEKTKLFMKMIVCKNSDCGDSMTLEEWSYYQKSANPRCPNVECDFHKNPPSAKSTFVISVVEEGIMGKIFKSEAYGIVSCKNCGEVIGVGGKG